ncbi:MAG: hypothetical protein KAT58_08500 [candidate division Zixibacteria bacterium]|nr:hypothetical protein [candidate division Zixibacteria bacterium]
MAEEEKDAQAKQPAAEAKVKEKEELKEILGDAFATFTLVKPHLSHFKSRDGLHVEGAKLLDPNNESYNKFLTGEDFAPRRKQLKQRLHLWADLLDDDVASDEFADKLDKMIEETEANLGANMKSIHQEIRPLEFAYRGVDLFFQNAAATPESEVYAFFANAGIADLTDPNDREMFEYISQQIYDSFGVYDIRNCWSLCCVPGYLGSVKDIDTMARDLGMPSKVQILTDFKHFDTYEDLSDELDDPSYDDLRGNDEFKQYIAVFGNYVKAEKPESRFDTEPLWLPPSPLIAGLMYRNDDDVGIQAPSAGKINGKLGGVQYTKIRLTEAKNTKVNEKGVNCLLNWQGEVGDVVAMGADTLSKEPRFRNYTIKRTYDYIYKVMRNYLNQQVYKGFDEKMKKAIDNDLNKFLSLLQRNKVINGFTCTVHADQAMLENQQMMLEVALNTKTPIKQYVVKLEAMQDEAGNVGVK